MMCKNIWKEELIRCFWGWRFPCAVILTVILYLCITMRYLAGNRVDILYCYRLVADNDLLLISYAFCSWVYVGVYCDEKRNRYDRHCLLRVPAGKLVRIRMCVCIFSGMMVKSMGIWGYLIVMRWNYPLLDGNGSGIREFGNAGWGFSELIVQNKMLLYFFIEILMAGCLAGLLCGVAFYFSLFLQEKEAVLICPVFFSYFSLYYGNAYLKLPIWLQINRILDISYNVLNNSIYSLAYGVACFIAGCFFLCILAEARYKRLVYE